MLTKDHLRFSIKSGRLRPELVPASDAGAAALASDLLALFRDAQGQSVGELEESAGAVSDHPLAGAFAKLLFDQCDVEEDDGTVLDFRWDCLLKAQALRRAQPDLAIAAFQGGLAQAVGQDFGHVKDRLYADLPDRRRVKSFKDTTPELLLARYNCAQVQGLLLRARTVLIKVTDASLGERRELFRQLRFHRLMADVREGKKPGILELELSGPLGMFEQAATYGLRLANFFPHVLHLPQWEVRAEVHIKNKERELRLDQTSGLTSHYKRHTPYIPEELTAFVDAFNAKERAWRAAPGGDFVNIGRESYCFPDLTITGQNGTVAHIELFHRWHAKALVGRLQAVEKSPVSGLLLGVSKSLAKTPEIAGLLGASRWFGKFGFIFSEFPTPRGLAPLLERVAVASKDLW